jgi:hypothetical protein
MQSDTRLKQNYNILKKNFFQRVKYHTNLRLIQNPLKFYNISPIDTILYQSCIALYQP